MRPVLHGDVVAAARVLLRVSDKRRRGVMNQMLEHASAADKFRKRLGRGLRNCGNGSLMAVAMGQAMLDEPFLDDPDYCRCLVVVLEVLILWRSERASFNRTRKTRRLARSDQVQAV